MRFVLIAALMWVPTGLMASHDARIDAILDQHILPVVEELATDLEALNGVAQQTCAHDDPDLRAAYTDAMSAWAAASHLRFGPAEKNLRAFSLAFWPDTKGAIPKTLRNLITTQDPVVENAEDFATVSIAGHGLFALEFLLFDSDLQSVGEADYRCDLMRAITQDMQRVSAEIQADWQDEFAAEMRNPGAVYQSEEEVLQELFKALTTGLEINADMRLGRPMGSFDKPRPRRAEAWRSGLSLSNVDASMQSLGTLAALLAQGDAEVSDAFAKGFARVADRIDGLEDPALAGVATPQGRFRVETLQQEIRAVKSVASQQLGPSLGVAAGFNSLDGD